ncbi:MAG: sulfotransferase [Planctomycetes bacterium]|nr:sulfotransferase [Planctomycetota bacterium]
MSKLVYIAGVGHSGSTLLDIVTGTIPGVFSAGEMTYLPSRMSYRKFPCSCLSALSECRVWSKVVADVSKEVGFDVRQDPLRYRMALLQRQRWKTDLLQDICFTLQRAVFGYAMQRRPLGFIEGVWRRALNERIGNNWRIFDAICETCDVRYVVDSSKHIYRAKLLHSRRPADVYVLLLIRDLRGLAWSSIKRRRDPIRTVRKLVRQYNRILSTVRNMEGASFTPVKYERLCSDPIGERRRIAGFLGLDDPGSAIEIDPTKHHLTGGNPMRMKGRMDIRLDESWKENLTPDLRARVEKIASGLDDGWRELLAETYPE